MRILGASGRSRRVIGSNQPDRFAYSWWHVVEARQELAVSASHQTRDGSRCVDIFSRPNGTFGFEEFRRDPEDMGAWAPIAYFSGREYPTEASALQAARRLIPRATAVLGSSL